MVKMFFFVLISTLVISKLVVTFSIILSFKGPFVTWCRSKTRCALSEILSRSFQSVKPFFSFFSISSKRPGKWMTTPLPWKTKTFSLKKTVVCSQLGKIIRDTKKVKRYCQKKLGKFDYRLYSFISRIEKISAKKWLKFEKNTGLI